MGTTSRHWAEHVPDRSYIRSLEINDGLKDTEVMKLQGNAQHSSNNKFLGMFILSDINRESCFSISCDKTESKCIFSTSHMQKHWHLSFRQEEEGCTCRQAADHTQWQCSPGRQSSKRVSTMAAMPPSQPKQGDIPEKTAVLRSSALSYPHCPPHTHPPLPISRILSHSSPFFPAHLWAVKSCFVLCGGLWKRASRVKVGQRGGIGDEGGGGEERERESAGLNRVKDREREEGRREGGREGYVTHLYSVNLSKLLRKKLCCCLREQVSNTHICAHTRVTSTSQVSSSWHLKICL